MHLPKQLQQRFIPTRVGNTKTLSIDGHSVSVHPHACGEYGREFIGSFHEFGSSPRVWGIPTDYTSSLDVSRFIPTRVGNTIWICAQRRVKSVHPHACGEYADGRLQGLPVNRFIPTRVGNTGLTGGHYARMMVHPHACGEYPQAMLSGSS